MMTSIGWMVTASLALMPWACSRSQEPDTATVGGWPVCKNVSYEFVDQVRQVLADSAGMFKGDYPDATPLTCQLLEELHQAFTDDSVRYHFEHLSQRYWARDAHYHDVDRYIHRHLDFHLSIAQAAHFFGDIRIMGLRNLQEYRRMRPLVCTTKEGSAKLEEQDRQAVRYLLLVLETTPWHISGSENATIHRAYITHVARALDLFTGQEHIDPKDLRQNLPLTDAMLRTAIPEWRRWLAR